MPLGTPPTPPQLVVPGFKSLVLSCATKQERNDWVDAIIAAANVCAMESAFSAIASTGASSRKSFSGSNTQRPSMRMSIRKPKDENAAEEEDDSDYGKINAIVLTIAENTQPPDDVEDAYNENTAAMAADGKVPRSSQQNSQTSTSNWRAMGQAHPLLNLVNVNHDDAKLLAATAGIGLPQALNFVIAKKKEGLEIDAIIIAYHAQA